MQIHHQVSHSQFFAIDPEELVRMDMAEAGLGDEAEWDALGSQYEDETLAGNVVAFLHEADTD